MIPVKCNRLLPHADPLAASNCVMKPDDLVPELDQVAKTGTERAQQQGVVIVADGFIRRFSRRDPLKQRSLAITRIVEPIGNIRQLGAYSIRKIRSLPPQARQPVLYRHHIGQQHLQ